MNSPAQDNKSQEGKTSGGQGGSAQPDGRQDEKGMEEKIRHGDLPYKEGDGQEKEEEETQPGNKKVSGGGSIQASGGQQKTQEEKQGDDYQFLQNKQTDQKSPKVKQEPETDQAEAEQKEVSEPTQTQGQKASKEVNKDSQQAPQPAAIEKKQDQQGVEPEGKSENKKGSGGLQQAGLPDLSGGQGGDSPPPGQVPPPPPPAGDQEPGGEPEKKAEKDKKEGKKAKPKVIAGVIGLLLLVAGGAVAVTQFTDFSGDIRQWAMLSGGGTSTSTTDPCDVTDAGVCGAGECASDEKCVSIERGRATTCMKSSQCIEENKQKETSQSSQEDGRGCGYFSDGQSCDGISGCAWINGECISYSGPSLCMGGNTSGNCNVPEDTEGSIRCRLPGTRQISYCCPTDKSYLNSGKCVASSTKEEVASNKTGDEGSTASTPDWCGPGGAAGCNGKQVSDACGNGGTCKLVKNKSGNEVCGCVGQRDSSSGCNQGDNTGCGSPPEEIPSFNEAGSIGPFPETGKLVIYFKALDVGSLSGIKKMYFNYDGQTHEVTPPSENVDRKKIVTDIEVKKGDSIQITRIDVNQDADKENWGSCPPVAGPPYKSIGWKSVNADNTCGLDLPGPPTTGKCTPYPVHDVSGAMSWAESDSNGLLGQQCWADFMEWPGDYDFNDYLLQFSYEPVSVSGMCQAVKMYTQIPGGWEETPVSQLADKVKVGDKIRLAVKGDSPGVVRGRFKVNGGSWIEASNRNTNGEYYIEYTLNKAGRYSIAGEVLYGQ